jgi:hypothetical protein
MLQAYASAILPDPCALCGVRLAPLTLGHMLLLHRVESPFVTGARYPGAGDLLLAIILCSQPWETSARQWADGQLPRRIRRLRLKAAITLRRSHTQAVQAFQAYIDEGTRGPETWTNRDNPRTPGAPWLQSVALVQQIHLHKTESAAWATPVAQALWDQAAWAESQGHLQIMTEQDRALIRHATHLATLQPHTTGPAARN